MSNLEQPYIVGLDIGTTKIVCIAAQKNERGLLKILGLGKSESHGIVNGEVLNINETQKSIIKAVEACKKSCSNINIEINEVYVGIAGGHIKSDIVYEKLKREKPHEPIAKEDLDTLMDRVYQTDIGVSNKIITVISEGFIIDDTHQVNNDKILGCTGKEIDAMYHVISGDSAQINKMFTVVEKSGLKIKELYLQPLASKIAVTTNIDDEAGVAVLDIGGGTSDLTVVIDNQFKHTCVIPVGGLQITEDIRKLGMIKAQAEKLKIEFGSAIAIESYRNKFIAIPALAGLKSLEINQYELSTVINKRMSEILDKISTCLTDLDVLNRLSYGIIITGGGALLQNLKQLVECKLGLSCRIGYANCYVATEHNSDIEKELKQPFYATCIGLILLAYENIDLTDLKLFTQEQVEKEVEDEQKIEIEEKEFVHQPELNTNNKDLKRRVDFFGNIKRGLLDLFKEEKDTKIN
ncbi:MAG: cell division protein FtsA [Sediminibacterium sp.]|nr:cell division protein FtsA [Sediminibacterium sp.]